jgi:transcription factor SPN1
MDLDTETLKEAKLGPIVLFYTKTKRVTPAINRAADALVQAWSRPIIKRPANFRSRHIDNAADVEDAAEERERMAMDVDGEGMQSQSQSQSQSQGSGLGQAGAGTRRKRFDVATALMENKGRKGARMPVIKVGRAESSWVELGRVGSSWVGSVEFGSWESAVAVAVDAACGEQESC